MALKPAPEGNKTAVEAANQAAADAAATTAKENAAADAATVEAATKAAEAAAAKLRAEPGLYRAAQYKFIDPYTGLTFLPNRDTVVERPTNYFSLQVQAGVLKRTGDLPADK